MKKYEIINAIDSAKSAHEQQMDNAKALLKEGDLERMTAVEKSNCQFITWLHGSNFDVKKVLGEQFFIRLDMDQDEWHRDYRELYAVFSNKHQQSFFSKIFKKDELTPIEVKMAEFYHERLKTASNKLLNAIDSAKRRVYAMPESRFA
ncbi:MAG: hypothetical protein QM497_02920 [Sulfurimonas sp.]